MRIAHELEPATIYVADFNDNLALFCERLEQWQDGRDGLVFITMWYRWLKHDEFQKYYEGEVYSIDFEYGEQFDYSPEYYVITEELLP